MSDQPKLDLSSVLSKLEAQAAAKLNYWNGVKDGVALLKSSIEEALTAEPESPET